MALADQVYGFYIPNVSLMGVGSSKEAGPQAKALGASKALIVTDKVLNQLGVAARIQGQLEEAGVKAVVFDGAEPNPTDTNVADGLAVYAKNGCDAIVSLGGGSAHDCAKGIGMVATNGGNIPRLRGHQQDEEADAAVRRHQHHGRHGERDDALLHHHEHQHAREDGDR
jgi:alcohol dehydrogenase